VTTGQVPRVDPGTGRGPCSRVLCGHAEHPDHAHDGTRTHCAICGPDGCPTYRAPGRRKCGRCGVPENEHASVDGRLDARELADTIQAGACPWWVRPAPAPLRAVTSMLRRFGF
jgi:hypothetical protein